ncbi:ABC transporter permease [Paenibacillus sp. HJGM_3]|uniref:ABC transporter permease n=1 Tax=Paenibacillus sp. HJGM_3 TaxID=3379816 RepID=UPI00385B427D
MRLGELIGMAMRTVLSNPLRTILTMLGVIIGVASVVTLVAIGRGTSAEIAKQYENLGTNMLVVNVNGNGRATQLDYNELMKLEGLPEIDTIAPTILKPNSNVKFDRTQEKYTMIGTNDRYAAVVKAQIDTGRFLSEADLELRANVAVLGSEVSKKFFGFLDPVGEQINIDGIVFTVVGRLKEKGQNVSGTSIDSMIMVPLETARRQFKLGTIRTTYIEAPTKDDIYVAQDTMKQYLTYKFKSDTGFQLVNQDELLKARTATSNTLTKQLVSVACISLLVGGIGIMNIMLVTVSERTREIGIRKSIGAKRRNILFQFLVEAGVISGIGGLIGLLFGIGLALAWPAFNPDQPTLISVDISIYAFLFSALVGIVFGLYPANKASKLRPIDALRFD